MIRLKPKLQCIGFDRKKAHDCDAVHEVCRRKYLDEPLTRFALGYAVCNVDKGEAVEEMIGEMKKLGEMWNEIKV